jgi:uncharacterized repeat protein (TIGR04052 family)
MGWWLAACGFPAQGCGDQDGNSTIEVDAETEQLPSTTEDAGAKNENADAESGDAAREADASKHSAQDAAALLDAQSTPSDASAVDGPARDASLADAALATDAATDAGADAAADAAASHPRRKITLRFSARIGSEPFACGREYSDIGTQKTRVTPSDFRFYVSEIRLIDAEGKEAPFAIDDKPPFQQSGVGLITFTDGQGYCAVGGVVKNEALVGSAEIDKVTGLVFSTSVPDALNHGNPAMAPAPLQAAGAHWSWLQGYKFFMAEAVQVGLDGGVPGNGLLHVGSTQCSMQNGNIACAHGNHNTIRLGDFDPDAHTVVADFGAVFSQTDVSADSQCHSTGERCGPLFEAVGIDFVTGEVRPSQRVFRKE